MKKQFIFILTASMLFSGCKQNLPKEDFVKNSLELASQQLEAALEHTPDTIKNFGPRTIVNEKVSYITYMLDWTVGFFPGSLWYMYDYTKDVKWLQKAERFTNAIEDAKLNTDHHDVGFVIGSSFGNGYRLTRNEHYKEVMIQAAKSLCTRFDQRVGCIKSWNTTSGWQAERGWQYPVIIDNMMNLELLFNATKFSGDSTFFNIAVTHADVTLKNHYRPDFSCYHVIDYDSITGAVRNRHTAQGYAHESSWARGQAWGLYGFVMCYRETGYKRYLEQAEQIANWWITHKNLPDDGVPYWDFDAPDKLVSTASSDAAVASGTLRDASAAAIAASALIELASFKTTRSEDYLVVAEETLASLSSPAYMASPGENGYFILKHCVGSIPHNAEIDVPLNYADYYFLEALIRYMSMPLNNTKVDGYKGIWFTLGQFSEYGDKYSGGLGTYTAKHIPLAIYAPEVQKTFFVYGGMAEGRKSNADSPDYKGKDYGNYLLCMAGCFDHKTQTVTKPTVVHDKNGIFDPHDDPTISIDSDGYIWVFVAGRARTRPGFIYKSRQPYSVDSFDQILEDEICYPQPKYIAGKGFLLLFTKYMGQRLLYFNTSPDGYTWTEHQQLAAIKRPDDKNAGHYQISGQSGDKIVFFFNWHPDGNVDRRTNIYYLQTVDFGKTWTKVDGVPVSIPVTEVYSETLIREFFSKGQNVYIKDVAFDENDNPIALYVYGTGHEPGPENGLKKWAVIYWNGKEWENHEITTSDHNYDTGSIWATKNKWTVIAPTENSPQPWGGGGEIVIWESVDKGKSWKRTKQITKNSPRNHNYIRKVVNGVDPFICFWADGNPEKMSQSLMYFADSKGNVWQLPYTMTNETQKPQKGLPEK